MKSPVLLNATWLVVALAAFFLGRQFAPVTTPDTSASGAAPGAGAGSLLTGGGSGGSGSNGGAGDAGGAVGESELAAAEDGPAWLRIGSLSGEQMAEAMASVVSVADPLRRAALFSQLLERLTPENAAAAFDTLSSEGTGWENRQSMALLAYAWGKIDPETAMDRMGESGGMGGMWSRGAVLGGWASADPEGAIAFVDGFEGGREAQMAMSMGLINGLARTDPDQATDYLLGMEAGDMRRRMLEPIVEAKSRQGVAEAADWAARLPDEDGMRAEALDRVAQDYARKDIEAAKAWATEMAGEEHGRRAIGEVVEVMAGEDPAGTLDWVNDLPEGSSRNEGYEEVFKEWARSDADAAGGLLGQLDASPEKDYAVRAFAQEVTRRDPEAATQWASIIGDEEMRTSTVVQSARAWRRQDPEGADAWIGQAGLPDEAVQQIQRGGGDRADWMNRLRGAIPGRN